MLHAAQDFCILDVGRATFFADGGAAYSTALTTADRTAHVGGFVPGETVPASLSRGWDTFWRAYTARADVQTTPAISSKLRTILINPHPFFSRSAGGLRASSGTSYGRAQPSNLADFGLLLTWRSRRWTRHSRYRWSCGRRRRRRSRRRRRCPWSGSKRQWGTDDVAATKEHRTMNL